MTLPCLKYFTDFKKNPRLYLQDFLLITIMATLAACGLIYQYILSHYAGRVLGIMEHAIYTMIGLMIVSMGIGAFSAKYIKSAHTGFAWLEAAIALLGALGILLISGSFAIAVIFPEILAENFALPPDAIPMGKLSQILYRCAEFMPFILGFCIGIMIGMEIPFIARIREELYGTHLTHNIGTIYGADYIGAGIGAAIFILYMLAMPPQQAALYTALTNLIIGLVFLIWYARSIHFPVILFITHLLIGIVIAILFIFGDNWHKTLEDTLYADHVIFSADTPYQHITLTKRKASLETTPIHTLFINGRTQFSSDDTHIYHDMLVHPAMLTSAKHNHVLIIGGGDGLALKTVLEWQPKDVTLIELDKKMIEIFKSPLKVDGKIVNKHLLKLNNNAFNDPRVQLIFADAFHGVDQLIAQRKKFDTIIVDLPDPSHPNLNKLYSVRFYKKLYDVLNGDGAISIQSTSPYHAKKAFLTIGVTLKEAGFADVDRYQQNVPSFGQWGWSIATKYGSSVQSRLKNTQHQLPEHTWATYPLIKASFTFNRDFFKNEPLLEPNRLGTHLIYRLHQEAWTQDNHR